MGGIKTEAVMLGQPMSMLIPQVVGLKLTGEETFSISGMAGVEGIPKQVTVSVDDGGQSRDFTATVRIDTPAEAAYFQHGAILQYVLRLLLAQ